MGLSFGLQQVWTLDNRGQVTDRLPIILQPSTAAPALSASGTFIAQVCLPWISHCALQMPGLPALTISFPVMLHIYMSSTLA